MNVGFSNKAALKAQLLAAALQPATDYDAIIQIVGLGVAAAFEKYCCRKFMYTAGLQEVFGADSASFLLRYFPVVAPITLVEYKQDEPTGWVAQLQIPGGLTNLGGQPLQIRSLDAGNGIIYFPDDSDCGEYWSQMRFTYTGGFWWPMLDAGEPGYPDTIPAGATALPNDIQFAWFLQCKYCWQEYDPLGEKNFTGEKKGVRTIAQQTFADLDLIPLVKEMLAPHIRYALV